MKENKIQWAYPVDVFPFRLLVSSAGVAAALNVFIIMMNEWMKLQWKNVFHTDNFNILHWLW